MKKLITFLILFNVIFISGCKGTNEAGDGLNNNTNNPQFMNVKNSPVDDISLNDSQKISQHLVNLATRVPNVENASAVALGKFAIVGIDVDKNLDRSKVGTIKYTVAEALKKDKYGANAIVVADPDLTARINEIGEDIQNGRPVQGILNELSDIVGRIMPEVPGDLHEPSVEQKLEEPKNEINNKDARNLEKTQDEQSNHMKNEK